MSSAIAAQEDGHIKQSKLLGARPSRACIHSNQKKQPIEEKVAEGYLPLKKKNKKKRG
jgi:hypothetical protein